MSLTRYIYNPKTLRYERARLSWPSVILTTVGLLFFGFLFFVGLMWLQNRFITTPVEEELTAENTALSDYKVQLALLLSQSEDQLAVLESKDETLYEKIFEARRTNEESSKTDAVSKDLLLAEPSEFQAVMGSLISMSSALKSTAQARNQYFADQASVDKEDLGLLSSVPSFPPIANIDASKIVSGFGQRINPFHKGMYHHDGIDLAAPRGSEVLAAARGTIVAVSHSDLQAGFGNYIAIDHGNGYVTHYANLGEIIVRYGQQVKKGQAIGKVGISGGSVAPHVHYEVIQSQKNVDPVKFLVHGLTPEDYQGIWLASRKQNQSLD